MTEPWSLLQAIGMSRILFLILVSLNSRELTTKDPGHATLQMWLSQTHWFLQGGHAWADVSVPSTSWSWRGSRRSFTSSEACSRRPLLWRWEGDKVSPVSWVVLSCSKRLHPPFDTGSRGLRESHGEIPKSGTLSGHRHLCIVRRVPSFIQHWSPECWAIRTDSLGPP